MGRKTKDVLIPPEDGNRDSGKVFVVKEMPASQATRWAERAIAAAANSAAEHAHLIGTGMMGVAQLGFQALFGIKDEVAGPLLDELMGCVRIRTSSGVVRELNPAPDAEDIEEVKTHFLLRAEAFAIHTGFSLAELKSKLISAATVADYVNTPTSTGQSGQL